MAEPQRPDVAPEGQLILRSSYADIYVDKATGEVRRRDYAAMGGTTEWDDVHRFDPADLRDVEAETDVRFVAFWDETGDYHPPERD